MDIFTHFIYQTINQLNNQCLSFIEAVEKRWELAGLRFNHHHEAMYCRPTAICSDSELQWPIVRGSVLYKIS